MPLGQSDGARHIHRRAISEGDSNNQITSNCTRILLDNRAPAFHPLPPHSEDSASSRCSSASVPSSFPADRTKSAPCPAPPALAASSANENSLRIYTALTMVLWLQKSDNANSRQESNFQKLFEASTSSFCQSQSPASSFCSTPHSLPP